MPLIKSGKPTPKQLEALELLEGGMDLNSVAQRLAISRPSVYARLTSAKNVMDTANENSFGMAWPLSATYLSTDSDRSTNYADHTPYEELEVEAKAVGIPASKLRILKQRMHFVKDQMDNEPAPDLLTDKQLQEGVRGKMSLVLKYMDNFTLATAKMSELSSAFKVLFEAKQLLDGKPTQIMDSTARMELDKLVPQLMKEARRRGIMVKDVEGEVIEGTINQPKKKKLKIPPKKNSHFPHGATKAYFDRNGYKWPGADDDPNRTKWRDIDENGY